MGEQQQKQQRRKRFSSEEMAKADMDRQMYRILKDTFLAALSIVLILSALL